MEELLYVAIAKRTVGNVNLTFGKCENSSFVKIAISHLRRNESSNMYEKDLC